MCDSGVMVFIDKLFVSKFVFYVVLFELMVKKLPQYLLRRLLVHVGHLTLLQNNPQALCYCKIGPCKMRVSGCEL